MVINLSENKFTFLLKLRNTAFCSLLGSQMNRTSLEQYLQPVIILPLSLLHGPSVIFSIKKGPVLY